MFGLDGVLAEVRTLVNSFRSDMDAMVTTLRETNKLLAEQNELLRKPSCGGSCACKKKSK